MFTVTQAMHQVSKAYPIYVVAMAETVDCAVWESNEIRSYIASYINVELSQCADLEHLCSAGERTGVVVILYNTEMKQLFVGLEPTIRGRSAAHYIETLLKKTSKMSRLFKIVESDKNLA